ncbi:hypothetical protein Pint_06726 [Pistacia integerrima]|uniref:Uncharacterized protein n=1 Tax=Pistacia integerrima TaxID=434235 RepID=A0ACC0XSE4_9ROSI|nr:hypothetical protein Pint_06726 [Pistacia integerrima]
MASSSSSSSIPPILPAHLNTRSSQWTIHRHPPFNPSPSTTFSIACETQLPSISFDPSKVHLFDCVWNGVGTGAVYRGDSLIRSSAVANSFIVSFSFYTANPENDGKRVQEFYLTMECAIRDHPLWVGATEEEIDSALEGLEQYVMTELFSRTFSSTPEDLKIDQEISEKKCLLQTFLRSEHLDIPVLLQNEASWLLVVKELQKMNAVKAPREKILCIMNCGRVISNLLLTASMSANTALAGADDFLPVLIYANPLQLQSNLKFIQLYRRQKKLVSEAAYYFTNLVSAKTFVVDLNAKSLSIEEIEFEENMQAARLANKVPQVEVSSTSNDFKALGDVRGPGPSGRIHGDGTHTSGSEKGLPGSPGTANDDLEKELPGSPRSANDDIKKESTGKLKKRLKTI